MSERHKFTAYNRMWVNSYFWRTQDQQEIDYLEEQDGSFNAWEFKWSQNAIARFSKTFEKAYPCSVLKVVTPQNIEDFLLV